jgi:hypothetical protein
VWVRERQDREQGFAVVQLIRMGDPKSGTLLLDWVKAHPEEAVDAYDDPELGLGLARSACPEIEAWFLERVKEDARFVGAILETRGLPRNQFPSYHDAAPTEEELALLRRPPAESLEFLFRQPDTGKFDLPEGVGLWKDARVLAFLRELRDKPHEVGIPTLTGQLAAAGDERARREMWSAVRVGRYRWICYENGYDGLTLGYDAQTYPFLLYDTEGNCCRGGHVARMFEAMMGGDHLSYRPHGIDGTPARNARRWIDLYGGRFVFSPFSDYRSDFTPAVR